MRTVLKNPPVGLLWNLGESKNTLRKLALGAGDPELVELADDVAGALQLCDQYTYDNNFIYFQPGNGKVKIKEPKLALAEARRKPRRPSTSSRPPRAVGASRTVGVPPESWMTRAPARARARPRPGERAPAPVSAGRRGKKSPRARRGPSSPSRTRAGPPGRSRRCRSAQSPAAILQRRFPLGVASRRIAACTRRHVSSPRRARAAPARPPRRQRRRRACRGGAAPSATPPAAASTASTHSASAGRSGVGARPASAPSSAASSAAARRARRARVRGGRGSGGSDREGKSETRGGEREGLGFSVRDARARERGAYRARAARASRRAREPARAGRRAGRGRRRRRA